MPMMATSSALPPPVGGWDTRESLADMPETHAIILDNFIPGTDTVILRRGFSSYATGMTGDVDSLIEYVPLTGSGALFAANAGNIYDVSSAGAVGAAVSSGHTNDRWQYVNMGTSAGQFVRLFNGADTPLLYNGSTWATTAITGPTATNLIWCNLHQRRLWFGEINSLDAWYLAVNSVSGTATKFPLAGIASLGGHIMAMGTWSRDAGAGMDDVAAFITSEGEVIVYSGTDPSDVAAWSLVGVYRIGKPIGRRCIVKGGSDLIIITQDGFVPLSGVLITDRSQTRLVALSDQISKAVNDAVRFYGSVYGWQPILYPKGALLIFNIPISTLKSHQYVFNTITGAPSRFTGIDAICFGLLNDNLYWGGHDGVVYKNDDGTSDNAANIEGDAMQAYSYFGSPQLSKGFKMAEPIFQSDGNPNAAIDLNVDFQAKQPTGVAAASAVTAGLWGVSKWGIGKWGTSGQIYNGWRGIRGIGRAASLRIRIDTTTARPAWVATNFLYVKAGYL
jgi:hypothetical protein